MGELYLYQKFPFLSQKKRGCLKYIFGLLLLFTTYRMPLKVTVLRIPRFRNNFYNFWPVFLEHRLSFLQVFL